MFYGHEITAMFVNVGLAFFSLGLCLIFLSARIKSLGTSLLKVTYGYLFLIFFPNSAYLFLEVRHLVQVDGIADTLEVSAILIFGALSLLGLILTVKQIYLCITEIPEKFPVFQILGMVGLSFMASWGAVLGKVYDLDSIQGLLIFPIFTTSAGLSAYKWVVVGKLTIFLSIVCFIRYFVKRKWNY